MLKIFPIMLLAIVLAGCPPAKPPTADTPPVTTSQTGAQAWARAVDYFGTIETARHAANQLALVLSKQNKIPVGVLDTFVSVDKAAISANKLLQASPNSFSKSIATQVALLAGQILSELSQWDAVEQVAAQPMLVKSIKAMESAATAAKELN